VVKYEVDFLVITLVLCRCSPVPMDCGCLLSFLSFMFGPVVGSFLQAFSWPFPESCSAVHYKVGYTVSLV